MRHLKFDGFVALVDRLVGEIPPRFLEGLNGGVVVLPDTRGHPAASDLLTLGEYVVEDPGLGRLVVLYYGSFAEVGRYWTRRQTERRIRSTIAHEITHHLETSAGVDYLGEQDRRELRRWVGRAERGPREAGRRV